MKIRRVKGTKFKGDLITQVNTKEYECITIPRLLLIVNTIALNEQKRAEAKGWSQQRENLWFNRMCERVLEDGFMGIDLLDEKRWLLSTLKQTKLDEFEKENGSP